jgi:hypothetical protein
VTTACRLGTWIFRCLVLPRDSIAFCIFWICSCFCWITAPLLLLVPCSPVHLNYHKPRWPFESPLVPFFVCDWCISTCRIGLLPCWCSKEK